MFNNNFHKLEPQRLLGSSRVKFHNGLYEISWEYFLSYWNNWNIMSYWKKNCLFSSSFLISSNFDSCVIQLSVHFSIILFDISFVQSVIVSVEYVFTVPSFLWAKLAAWSTLSFSIMPPQWEETYMKTTFLFFWLSFLQWFRISILKVWVLISGIILCWKKNSKLEKT